jgi:hypothetical protein
MYAKDLVRNAQHAHINRMNNLAAEKTKGKDMDTFWRTEGFKGYDCICLHANKPEFVKHQGYILYSEVLEEPIFMQEPEDD